ncbi:Coat F domain-containing protein [Paenibacillus sp. 1_12]|uniref:spore coat protein n=1 Tax=Paenibacillus sp. 1_12 TaxID=1566278 RepID=UPI0008F094A5|nr:spore coat protein [Paenibacillus sp. 1_12]SFL90652.1 Coat F domain-containing protein [Paenibacillus sp. 1_12]
MYPSNYPNQQAFNQQGQQGQHNQQGNLLQEQDWANLLLSELKRSAREYTTAALEAVNPVLCQTFQNLANKTMQDQAQLFSVLSQMSGYGSVHMASLQEVQQQLQQHSSKVEQLQSSVQQSLQQSNTSQAGLYQQQAEQQAYQSYQPYQQSQAYSYPSNPVYSGNQGNQAFYGSQGTNSSPGSNSYGQGYSSNYSNSGSNTGVNQTQMSGSGYGQNLTSHSTASLATGSSNAKFAGSDSAESTRGGNSFNWTDTQDDDNSSQGSTQQSSSNRSNESGSKYIL